ncbi:SurA N-terminal domain-containing protein [Acinetobacter sp. MD2(2019)]|uniref:SurA N-terminal domain-containing protein n=1 Tax=Acinetobacter sp. MD2(2019) TaxID=2605273 RepID=UPI002D1F3ECF|nr:SurA N-terminal domain-containing protein [Acinetobacter sp. MD2(2019)]MEB3754175.1 SurA N-terminal domain-containing protein [Acinetobacter sp. MD2(2019)]
MESFRKLIKGWLGIALLVLFLTPLALVGIEGYFSGSNKTDVAKTVNGQDITNKDLDDLVKAYQQQYLQYVQGDASLLNMDVIRTSALDTLVAKSLLLQQAQKLGIGLSDAQFVQMLSQVPEFQVNGKFSDEAFGNYLRNNGKTKDQLIASLRQDNSLKMLSGTISNFALVSNADIEQLANIETEQRDIYLASVKLDEYKKNIQLSNQDIANYYNQHKNSFKQNASVDVDYVMLSPDMFTTAVPAATDAEIQQAYKKYVDQVNKSANKVVRHILISHDGRTDADALKLANDVEAKIKAGMSFDAAAKQYSEDSSSKAKGGLLEGYQAGTLGSKEFDDAVAALPNGQISQPVKTSFGYHIIEATAPNTHVPSLDAVKAQLVADIEKTKKTNAFTDAVNNLNETVVGADDLAPITQAFKTAKVNSAQGITALTKDPVLGDLNVKTKLFNDDVKNGDRNISGNIQLASGNVLWVKIKNYHPAGVQSLAQATAAIKVKLIDQKAEALAQAKIASTLNAFKTQPSAQVLANSPIKFEKAGILTRQNLKADIANAAFTLPAPKAGMWSVTTTTLPNEMVVIGVANVTRTGSKTLNAEQLQQLKNSYQQTRNEQELADYIEYLKSKAKMK